jgi:hypothetical protein
MDNDVALARLAEFASARLENAAFKLHQNDGYVRVSAGGFRAVCVSDAAPLCEFGASTVARINAALEHLASAVPPSATAQAKLERRLQAYIIRAALSSGLDLLPVLGPRLPFDQLLFALDEVPLNLGKSPETGGIRCDLLAVGINGGRSEPVVIELKWGRQLAQLRRQLDGFSALVTAHRPAFEKLLGAAVGRSGGISASRVHQIIVWPRSADAGSAGSARARSDLISANVSAVAFEPVGAEFTFDLEVAAKSAAWPRPLPAPRDARGCAALR